MKINYFPFNLREVSISKNTVHWKGSWSLKPKICPHAFARGVWPIPGWSQTTLISTFTLSNELLARVYLSRTVTFFYCYDDIKSSLNLCWHIDKTWNNYIFLKVFFTFIEEFCSFASTSNPWNEILYLLGLFNLRSWGGQNGKKVVDGR